VVFLPGVIATVVSVVMLRFTPPLVPSWASWTGVALQLAIQVVTVVWLLPLDRHLVTSAGGLDLPAYRSLLLTNWLRIGLTTAYALLTYWMIRQSFWQQTGVTTGRFLLLGTSSLGLYGVGNVWLVQLVCYRLWPHVGRAQAYEYHLAWWRSTWGVLFVPAGLVFLGAFALLWKRPYGIRLRLVWSAIILQLVIYASTAAWWAPLMARLVKQDGGMSLRGYQLLMSTHWVRLALITAYGIAAFYMLIKSATASQRGRP